MIIDQKQNREKDHNIDLSFLEYNKVPLFACLPVSTTIPIQSIESKDEINLCARVVSGCGCVNVFVEC